MNVNSVQVESVEVDGVGTCIAAIDFVSGVCDKSRRDAQVTVVHLLNSKNSNEAKKILCRKAVVPGFQQPTYVITYDECLDLVYLLPKQRVKHVIDFINKQFKRVRAGDQSLHEEIDARAVDDGLEARMAKESLGLPPQSVTNEERVLKRRRDELELVDMETKIIKTQCDFMMQLSGGELEARDRLFFMDRVRNIGTISAKMITEGTTTTGVITISSECPKLGYNSFKVLDWKKIGIIASRRYKERAVARGDARDKWRPPKHTQEAVGGNVRPVCTYMAPDDIPIVHGAIKEYAANMNDDDDDDGEGDSGGY